MSFAEAKIGVNPRMKTAWKVHEQWLAAQDRRYGDKKYPDPRATDLLISGIVKSEGLMRHYSETKVKSNGHKMLSKYDAAVAVPIDATIETAEGVLPTVRSIVTATRKCTSPTYLLVDINYKGDARRQKDELEEFDRQATLIQDAIVETTEGENISLVVARGPLPYGTAFTTLRNKMIWTAARDLIKRPLGTNRKGSEPDNMYMLHAEALYRLPFFMIDADSIIPEETFVEGARVLNSNLSVFVNGQHHYTGGIMEYTPDELVQMDVTTNDKLIYFTEMMRRKMFDPLPPNASRGYVLEDGLGNQFGAQISLGAVNVYSAQNESHFLVEAAERALDIYDNDLPYSSSEPYLHRMIANHRETTVYYAPYVIETSARGLFENIRRRGRKALVDWDQGADYLMYTDVAGKAGNSILEPEPTREELFDLIKSVYLHFAQDGSELAGSDVRETVELFNKLFPGNETIVAWFPPKVEQTQSL